MRRGEDLRGRVHPRYAPHLWSPLLASPSPRHPPTQQYQVSGEAQVGCGQQCYKAEVGRVGEAGHVADHKVKVDSADQHHDGGSDNFAHPWE